jgi:hypothetical protein
MAIAKLVLLVFNAGGAFAFAISTGNMFEEPWWKVAISVGFSFALCCNFIWIACAKANDGEPS